MLQRQIELKDWSWNSKKQRTRVYVDEMVDKDGNIWRLTMMLSDLSAELKGLNLSLCTNVGKCAWMGTDIDELAPLYLAGNLVTRVNRFCVLGSMVTSEDNALVTLQHRTTLAWGQFWNLKDQLQSLMKPRLALFHLAVIPIL